MPRSVALENQPGKKPAGVRRLVFLLSERDEADPGNGGDGAEFAEGCFGDGAVDLNDG